VATQAQIAEHLDLSIRRVQDLVVEGVLNKGADMDECRVNYIRYLRGNASGQHTGAGLKLTDERARLAKLQADKVEIELAELRGEVVRARRTDAEGDRGSAIVSMQLCGARDRSYSRRRDWPRRSTGTTDHSPRTKKVG
jgi:phage terminase Nu1 subunit (DNA packaging protein)